MSRSGRHYEPTIESIRSSTINAIRLAESDGHKRIAIPLIGGRIFLSRLDAPLTRRDLAEQIMVAAIEARLSKRRRH